ncbi:unnamed protein product [Rhizopus microsporus]
MEDVMSTVDNLNILEALVNHSSYMKNKPSEKQPTENKKSTTSRPVKVSSKKTNADYSINQRTMFIDRIIEMPVGQRYAAVVGKELDVEERTAQRWWRNYEETGKVPIKKSTRNPGRPNNSTGEYKTHVLDLVNDDPQVTVCDVVESLTKSFEDFSLTKSVIHKHMNETCNYDEYHYHISSLRNAIALKIYKRDTGGL